MATEAGVASLDRTALEQDTRPVFPSRYQVGLMVVIGAILLIALAPKLDTDLWWHLKDGRYIADHHTILSHDIYSFSFADRAWTNHEWLTELLLYGLYRLAGLWGPICFFAAVIATSYALVYARMMQDAINRFVGLFVLAAAFVAASSTWGARPQMLTLLFLAVFSLLTQWFIRARDRRILIAFPAIMVLWTNTHGGWVLGLAFLMVTLLGEWLNRATGHQNSLSSRDLQIFAIAIAMTLVATVFNPNGLQQVLYPLVWIFPSSYSNVLNEWVSVDFHQPVSMVFEGMVLLLIGSLFVARTRLNWTYLFLILVFTHLALSQSRNVAVWSVLIGPLLAFYLQQAITSLRPTAGAYPPDVAPRLFSRRTERILNVTLLIGTSLLYIVEAFHFISPKALTAGERDTFPAAALIYMNSHQLPTNTFNSYAWGGYVIWKGYPRYRDFIDGRANTLFDSTILNDYLDMYSAAPGWDSSLKRYRVGTVLVNPGAPLAQVLAESKDWKRVYRDMVAVVYTLR